MQVYCEMHAVYSSKRCTLRSRKHQLHGDISATEKLYIFKLIKIIVQFFEGKIPERVLLTGQFQYANGFQRFHPGEKLRRATYLSLQFLRFEYLHYDI